MVVVIDTFGTAIGKKSERLVIRRKDGEREEKAFFDVEQVMIASRGVSISSDAVQECMDRGIQIIFANSSGQPFGLLTSPEMNGTIKTRRAQLLSYQDRRGLDYILQSTSAKCKNQANTIKYFLKSRRSDDVLTKACSTYIKAIEHAASHLRKMDAVNIDEARDTIMSTEGQASRNYWQALALLLPDELEFSKREHQGAASVVNMMLNYGYGMLYSKA